MNRRVFMKSTGVALLAFGSGPAFLARAAAEAGEKRKTLVVLFLRGAMDGLSAVSLPSDRDLLGMRPDLMRVFGGFARTALDLDGRFALHPALAPLQRESSAAGTIDSTSHWSCLPRGSRTPTPA